MNRERVEADADYPLVTAAQRGDRAAFAALVTRYQDRIFNTCFRMSHDEFVAHDLAQSTFLQALAALPRFRARACFYTWLYRIAVNLALTQRRAQRRRPVSLDAAPALATTGSAPGDVEPAAALEHAEQQQRLAAALMRLEPDFRAAVVLRDIEGLDYAAIAEVLSVPVGTVKSRIARARTVLRRILTAENVNSEPGSPR